ncbi:MAG: hypothetical protein M1546_05970, partial [Chloroflexi bacterium]|nr:hypothetical protein [Chloroflexota bacterium]
MERSKHLRLLIPSFAVCVLALAALLACSPVLSATAPTDLEAVKAAWQRARQSGAYHFSADIQQTITPRATLLNIGRASKHEAVHLEGQVNLPNQQLHMTLWSQGGSVLDASSGVEVKVEGDHAAARQGAQDWQEIDNFTGLFAPQGDWMAFLAAATDVQRIEASGASSHAARYSFRIDGRSYAAYLRDQLEQQLAEQGELPPGVELDLSTAYADMSGQGELWIGANGLPMRQILHLQFPPRPDEQANQADVTADFSGFDAAEDEGRLTPGLLSPSVLNRGPFVAASLAFVFVLVAHRRSRKWHAGVVVTLIVSMLFSPLLQSARAVEVADRLLAKAQAEKQRAQDSEMQQTLSQAVAEPEQNPNVSPLDAARAAQEVSASLTSGPVSDPAPGSLALAAASNSTSSSTEDCDSGDTGDNDGDGLTNYEECVLSTDPGNADTDGDGLDDDQEVNGFSYKDKNWYTSPRDLDTNKDGLGDAQEWDANDNGQPDDTDGDGTPDLFDLDNDDDGVPDSLDLSPYYRNGTVYTSDSPFELVVDNLTQDKPTFVDFQVRPVITDHLWYAFNVLQWPTG